MRSPLAGVLEHNRRDLLSLAGLTSRLLEIVAGGPDYAENAREALALGHVYARSRAEARAIEAFERAVTLAATSRGSRASLVTEDALHALAVAYRRARRFDEAARCWTALIESGCSSTSSGRRLKRWRSITNIAGAISASARLFAERNVDVSGRRESLKAAARQRLNRIERKISASAGSGGLLD